MLGLQSAPIYLLLNLFTNGTKRLCGLDTCGISINDTTLGAGNGDMVVYENAPIYLNMGLQLAALSEDVKDPVGRGTGCGGWRDGI